MDFSIHLFILVKIEVLTAMSVHMEVFWDVSPYCSVNIDRRFRGAYGINGAPLKHRSVSIRCEGTQ
jgi:hypothetical protein